MFPEKTEDGTNPTIKFKNIQHMMKSPYVIYADTESIIKPVDSPNTDSNTVQSSEHIPCSFAYTVVRSPGSIVEQPIVIVTSSCKFDHIILLSQSFSII